MNDDHLVSLVEDMSSKIDRLVESVAQIQDQVKNIPIRDEFNELKSDVQTIRQIVAGQDQKLTDIQSAS